MTYEINSTRPPVTWILAAALLLAPGLACTAAAHPNSAALSAELRQGQGSQDSEQEARDRAQERQERAQEARDREQERVDRAEELYDDGREALDDERFEKAEEKFDALASMNAAQADAALYWKAYAQNKLAKRDSALATIADLKRRFPQSRWLKDASALEIEVRQSAGQPPRPESQSDDDLKMLALQGLMNSAPDRALPLLEKVIEGPGSPREKDKALFVLSQNGSPQAREILGRIARGQSNPDLQRKAVQYLGLFGGEQSHKTLEEIYASTSDASLKRVILRSYMIGGDRERLFAAARSEKDPSVRGEAIRELGIVHAPKELQQLYQTETSPDIRREILQAFFLSGDATTLAQAAQSEKDPEVRRTAIRNLGLIHSDEASKALETIYPKATDRETKEAVLNAFFLQGNAHALVAIARTEKDPELKKAAVSKLSIMHSKEATDYLMELLQK
jgi:Skp family chaperone for outer membrane proteins